MKKIQDIDLAGKRVLVRVDFNVSLDADGNVLDDFRLQSALPTISYLREQGAGIILLAHLGRPEGQRVPALTLRPVAEKMGQIAGQPVEFLPDCLGGEILSRAKKIKPGEIIMLENLRFYPGEENNDPEFAKKLAEIGEVYVNDAFAVSHRAHASVEAITKFLPGAAGLLLEKEIVNLSRVRDNPDHPLAAIIGGSKISTKIKLIQSFLNKAENIILGGALANTVLAAKGIAIGKSFTEEKMISEVQRMKITDTKIHLPVDAILCVDKDNPQFCHPGPVGRVEPNECLLDIGPETESLFGRIIAKAKMVVWNGPMGMFENEAFAHGTQAVAEAISRSGAFSVVGGGETVAYLEKIKLINKFSFVSTGGGAMMEFLSGKRLPGLTALK
ncbi:MAG: phosphoglycerate kinase [Candidatus Portnoybacteria bacterium]|jgi:3-phosphoglycerate kinase|nr:phosphoglycerate kinase [Candidatus Portnoybacteria bacterium]